MDLVMMVEYIEKEVKQYSNRLRVNIVKSDGMVKGEKIVLLKADDFKNLLSDYENLENKVKMLESERTNLEQMVEITLNPIHQKYQKELEDKDNQISEKDNELNDIKALVSTYNTSMNGLSLIDMVVRKKHKKMINDFQEKIWINKNIDRVTDVDVLPGSEDKT